ncbi:MAG TPA: helix-turn-helix domain-containing protein [Tissierellia bacterium]|nr:helix-turn-helix domain-containing protein [Tissierellia bacterium]
MPVQRKLKGIMVECGVTQGELAKLLGISSRAINYKINGERDFTLKEAQIISKFFEKSIEDIFLNSNFILNELK